MKKTVTPTVRLSEVKTVAGQRLATGIYEFDRVLGGPPAGGFVPGQVVLLAGEPGIGKSTLLLQVAESLVGQKLELGSEKLDKEVGRWRVEKGTPISNIKPQDPTSNFRPLTSVLYVCGEESPEQIKIRAERLGLKGENLELFASTDADEIIGQIGQTCLVIIDSIQTLTTADLASLAGSVSQVRECAQRLSQVAKEKGVPLILVGHVNKEGEIAGPKVLEHVVDTVLSLEGERSGRFRLLRAGKNRFGDPTEVGVFQMGDKGFTEVKEAAGLLLEVGSGQGVGSVVSVSLEGNRPLLLEVQALISKSAFNYPRRSATGYDLNRVYFLLAVLEKALGTSFLNQDVYVNVAGGIKAESPAADLAVVLALAGSLKNAALPEKTVVFGEVGLSGEVRHLREEERRGKEAGRLGYTRVVGPGQVRSVREALREVFN